jgi:hypothetical protein
MFDEIVTQLGDDEMAVLEALARRLLQGQLAYGRLDLARDKRSWKKEKGEELMDRLIYETFAEVADMLKTEKAAAVRRR